MKHLDLHGNYPVIKNVETFFEERIAYSNLINLIYSKIVHVCMTELKIRA